MPLFEKKYVDYLTVYKIPIGPNQLDPQVFYTPDEGGEYQLLPSIHAQITKDLEAITGNDQPYRIEGYYLVGGALKPGNKNRTDELKVLIYLNKNIQDEDLSSVRSEMILKVANELSNRKAIGTMRNIVYVPTTRKPSEDYYEGIYDIERHSWIKVPNGIS